MYLVPRGTRVRVKKPNGQIIEHVCRKDIAFPSDKALWQGYDLCYEQKGFTLIVEGDRAKTVNVQCPGCGRLL